MKYRRLGRTDLHVSEIGMGGVGVTGRYGDVKSQQAIDTLQSALRLGVNFFDTSPDYWNSEDVFGEALDGHRQDVILCTKVGTWPDGVDFSAEGILRRFPTSLRRLRVEFVDLVLIHDVQLTTFDGLMGKGGALAGLRRLQAEGVIRFVGISGRPSELETLIETDEFDALLTFNSYNLLTQVAGDVLMPLARRRDVGVILGGAFHQGLLSGESEAALAEATRFWDWDVASTDPDRIRAKLERLKAAVDHDPLRLRQQNLRFILSSEEIATVVIGAKTPPEIAENVRASDLGPLSGSEARSLLAM